MSDAPPRASHEVALNLNEPTVFRILQQSREPLTLSKPSSGLGVSQDYIEQLPARARSTRLKRFSNEVVERHRGVPRQRIQRLIVQLIR